MIKKFLKDSALYTLTGVFTKGIGFVMLPLYITFLSKEQYGVFDYIITIGSFLAVTVTLEIAQSVMRFVSEYQDNKSLQRKFISTAVLFTIICYFLLFFIAYLSADALSVYILGEKGKKSIILTASFLYTVMAVMYLITVIYRSLLDTKSVTIASVTSVGLTAVMTYCLLKFYDAGILALLWGIILGQGVVVIVCLFRLKEYLSWSLNIEKLKEMLVFSAPLVFSSVGSILTVLVDRIMIKEMLGFEDLGSYSVAARFAGIVSLLTIGFQSALAPLIYSNLNDSELKIKIRQLLYLYILGALCFVMTLFLFSDMIVIKILGAEFLLSAEIIPFLTLALVFQSAYIFFAGLSIVKKTKTLAKINIMVGVMNIILNYFLIGVFGLWGAVYATLITSVFYFFLNAYFSEKYFPIVNVIRFKKSSV